MLKKKKKKLCTQPDLQSSHIIIWDDGKSWHVGAVTTKAVRVRGAGDGCQGATPEVPLNKHDLGLVLWDLLHLVAPFAGQLTGCLAPLHTCNSQIQYFSFLN